LILVIVLASCSPDPSPTPTSRPALQEVSLPDISSAANPVQKQIRERYASLQAAIERANTPAGELAIAYGDLGKLLVATEYFDVAEACLANARALAPGELRWPYFLAQARRLLNEPAAAAGFFEQALALAPSDVPSLVWLADMHLALDRPEEAVPLLTRAQSLDSKSGAVLFGLGRAALARRDYARAVEYLERARIAGPQATLIHYPLALAYRGVGNRAKAEEHLRLRGDVDLPPVDPLLGELAGQLQNASAYEVQGSQAIDEKRWADAVTSLRKASELAPDNAFTRLNLGTSLYMTGDAAGALEAFRAAVRLSPGLSKAHFGIGVLMSEARRDQDAIDAFSRAVQADAGNAEARLSLADVLRRTGRVQESLHHYAGVITIDPSLSQASFGYAMALVRLRRYAEARDRLSEGASTFADQPGFAHALARLLAASPDDRVRDGARALAIMNGLMKTQQSLGTAETMAMTLAELGRFDEAVQWQRQAVAAAAQLRLPDVTSRLTKNLQLYEMRRPCRVPWTDDDPVHRPGAPS
jgi:tetratricopeptide (TPR) repeat protein